MIVFGCAGEFFPLSKRTKPLPDKIPPGQNTSLSVEDKTPPGQNSSRTKHLPNKTPPRPTSSQTKLLPFRVGQNSSRTKLLPDKTPPFPPFQIFTQTQIPPRRFCNQNIVSKTFH